jgi:hypothetical protein
VRAISSVFCVEVLTGSGHFSMTASRVPTTCSVLDKAGIIHEIHNVRITSGLVGQVWLVGEHLIHNL